MQEKIRLLLIEDDSEDAVIYTEMLRSSGSRQFKVTHARRIKEAVGLLAERPFDLVLVDLGLPDSQGIESFNLVYEVAPQLPVIVLTGLSDEELGNMAVQSGAQDYLVKNEVDATLLKRSVFYAIERKQSTEELRKSESKFRDLSQELAEANNLKDLLLDVISHDLRNNAGVIYGFADLLYRQDHNNELCTNILKSSQALLKVIENASTLAKLSHGENIDMVQVDADQIIRDIISEFSPSNTETFKIKYSSKGPMEIKANPIIAEIFRNYLSNAVKYGHEGKLIIVDAFIHNRKLVVKVSDLGDTIPEVKREVIFERLVRLSDKSGQGSGLGLAIVKRITDAHRGRAWVEPNDPRGNVFCVQLPVNR